MKAKKQIIAVDIDDVLAASTESLRCEVNSRLGVELLPEHYSIPGPYWGYYERVWEAHGLKGQLTLDELESQMKVSQKHVRPHDGAKQVLHALAEQYRMVIVTSRNPDWLEATEWWLNQHFTDTFSEIYFAGRKGAEIVRSKGDVCAALGARWLIDDSPEHCRLAHEAGVTPLLFGKYGWHEGAAPHLVRVADWAAVAEYFANLNRKKSDGQRS